jgi:hypothetical protein
MNYEISFFTMKGLFIKKPHNWQLDQEVIIMYFHYLLLKILNIQYLNVVLAKGCCRSKIKSGFAAD